MPRVFELWNFHDEIHGLFSTIHSFCEPRLIGRLEWGIGTIGDPGSRVLYSPRSMFLLGQTDAAVYDGAGNLLPGITRSVYAGPTGGGGTIYGATDEWGYKAISNRTEIHDLHATMLHLLGIDHERFTFKFQGLDMRLTGVEPAKVVKNIVA